MKHSLKTALAVLAVVLVSACSKADMDHFVAAGPGDWSAAGSGSEQRKGSGTNNGPRRCYQTSRTHMTCFD